MVQQRQVFLSVSNTLHLGLASPTLAYVVIKATSLRHLFVYFTIYIRAYYDLRTHIRKTRENE